MIGVEAPGAGERRREELARHDREERREQRLGRPGHGQRVCRAGERSGRVPACDEVAPAARTRSAASTTAGSVWSSEAIVQTGKSGSSAATGPCASAVAVSGSAATRQVSSSFSAISRAVANSIPRPTTNIRPTEANESATARACSSSAGSISSSRSAVARMSSAKRRPSVAAHAANRPSAAIWFRYVFEAATECSGPAASGSTASAAPARSDPTSFVSATVKAPALRARAR